MISNQLILFSYRFANRVPLWKYAEENHKAFYVDCLQRKLYHLNECNRL